MRRFWVGLIAAAAAGIGLAATGVLSPQNPPTAAAQAAALRPAQSLALPPPKAGRTRPLVAVAADNAGTETTDFIVPYGVLKESGVADVVALSTGAGPIALMPALTARADMTLAAFDAAQPAGADIVIVPALHDPDNEILRAWLRGQHDKGATIVAICEGAWVAAGAGLLDGKAATTHWHALEGIAQAYPGTAWVRDRRYVAEAGVMTTTGVSASIPASLALIEAIAGHDAAAATAGRLGVAAWAPAHKTAAFTLTAGRMGTAAWNWLAVWDHETVGVPVADGVDEIVLALTADAWSRTYRSSAIATQGTASVRSRRGLVLETTAETEPDRHHLALHGTPGSAIDAALAAIAARYGAATSNFVALQLEYPQR
ncbi:thiamine biosynthesis protein ThiJ [Oleomonas cavernae]|uniref:Thiamine biosynthesis protein ThiJ n=1 Tax=Oleomonas cavernae TaxID=2320859 RepID=A0A418WDA0_9PROT|nr:DJ-1/PfpI family protein [Oleomonas cavernae]RJF88011.1 thiamine biosynthesis protein ThiJ [Oleomonas cavernae]